MKTHILFSIVIPVYNAEKYLREMIESVINQTYPFWELIIIDDGSTDSSGLICDTYQCEKIKVIHQTNQGQMVSRIRGISEVKGDYTLVIDADDKLTSNCLESVYNIVSTKLVDMVIFPFLLCDEHLQSQGEQTSAPLSEDCNLNREDVLHWVIKTYNHGLVNKVIRTNIIKKGASEAITNKLSVNGDYALIIPILCNIKNAFYLNECLYLYRIYGESISHNYRVQHLIDTEIVSEEVKNTLIRYGLNNSGLIQDVYHAFWDMMGWMTEELLYRNLLNKDNTKVISEHCFFKESLFFFYKSKKTLLRQIIIGQLINYRPYICIFISVVLKARKIINPPLDLIKKVHP